MGEGSTVAHTPGPWEIYGSDVVQGPLEWGDDGYLVVKRPVSIAKVWKFPYVDERVKGLSVVQEKELRKSNDKVQAANLALIAAAPELLEALEEVINSNPSILATERSALRYVQAVEKARNVIKKARGEE